MKCVISILVAYTSSYSAKCKIRIPVIRVWRLQWICSQYACNVYVTYVMGNFEDFKCNRIFNSAFGYVQFAAKLLI